MSLTRLVRFGSSTGLCGVGAVVAHAGPAGLGNAWWLTVAALSGMIAGGAILAGLGLAMCLHRRADDVAAGVAAGIHDLVETAPFSALVGGALVMQTAAHLALVGMGVPAHNGLAGSWALHLVLAVAAAGMVWVLERLVWRASLVLVRAILAAILVLVVTLVARPRLHETLRLRRVLLSGLIRGRAPPLCA